MKTAVKILFVALYLFANGPPAYGASVEPFLTLLGGKNKLTKDDIATLADYELLIIDRFRFHEVNKNTWKAIKAKSSSTKIYLYQAGPLVGAKHDLYSIYYLNNLGRFDVSRGSKGGSINKDYPEWFLKNSSGERVTVHRSDIFRLDFGNRKFAHYWIKSTLQDISFQDWRADGIYMDVANVCRENPNNKNLEDIPVKYSNCKKWNINMNDYLSVVSPAIQAQNQLFSANRGHSRYASGTEAWLALDQVESPPDFLLEEGAFTLPWGRGDVQFLSLAEWKRQVDLPALIKHSSIGMMSHTDLMRNEAGKAISGERVTYQQIFRFATASYMLAKNLNGPPTYFMFVEGSSKNTYSKLIDTAIYRKFDLGVPEKNYEKVIGEDVYFRKYSNGYVYVNPTDKRIKNIKIHPNSMPHYGGVNIRKAGSSWYLDLNPHDAVLAKTITSPKSPNFDLQ